MENYSVYEDIASRTNGDIYIGVVGPVRTGKSTFIKRFMEELVIPSAEDSTRAVMTDELPQSAAGRTVMTTEPKFVPAQAAKISIREGAEASVRLVDCVGFAVEGAGGFEEDGSPVLSRRLGAIRPCLRKSGEAGNGKGHQGTFHHRHPHDDGRQHYGHSPFRLRRGGGTRRRPAQRDRQAVRHSPQLPSARNAGNAPRVFGG